ncbi:hypothetical protein ABZZ17_19300 [Streptomyces sp. NPDC006512]|uniref:hypothetical protein n=1 Tax=Streptomyces sp. NPDC006512 TaxID=3154307 RepID=UPI0033AF6DB4
MAANTHTTSDREPEIEARRPAAHPWQTRIALAALLLPLPCALAVAVDGGSVFRLTVPALLLGIPLALRRNRAWFMTSSVITAVLVLGWSAVGVLEGTWTFLTSAPMLICANFADPRAYRTPAIIVTTLACLIATPLTLLTLTIAALLIRS